MEKQTKDLENIKIERRFLASNFKGDKCQLLGFKNREGYSKYKA
jgi:hypothetical protein